MMFDGFTVTESGIIEAKPEYGPNYGQVIIPKETFVEAYNKYIGEERVRQDVNYVKLVDAENCRTVLVNLGTIAWVEVSQVIATIHFSDFSQQLVVDEASKDKLVRLLGMDQIL